MDGGDGAFGVEGAYFAGEGGGGAGDDPELDVGGLLVDDGGDDGGDSAEVDPDGVVGCLAGGAGDGIGVFADIGDDEFDEAGFGCGDDHGEGGAGGVGREVFEGERDHAVGDVGGEGEAAGVDLLFAVFIGGADGDLGGAGVDEDVHGVREGGAALDVAVGEEVEGAALGVDGGFVVDGAVLEGEEGAGSNEAVVDDLGAVSGGEDLVVL